MLPVASLQQLQESWSAKTEQKMKGAKYQISLEENLLDAAICLLTWGEVHLTAGP